MKERAPFIVLIAVVVLVLGRLVWVAADTVPANAPSRGGPPGLPGIGTIPVQQPHELPGGMGTGYPPFGMTRWECRPGVSEMWMNDSTSTQGLEIHYRGWIINVKNRGTNMPTVTRGRDE